MTDLEQFRIEVREWLEANCPESMRQPYREDADVCWGGRNFQFKNEDQRLWLERMAERGWTAPTWPAEYGGGGLDRAREKILREEMARINARTPLYSFGIHMIGPALLKFGSEELKQQHIPPIVRGEIWWAQGYSEPNAGSDLAGLQSRAEDKGDHFILNGSKVWTSYGDRGDWMFALVRTDPDAPKHLGISLVLFDMTTPGVSTRPIKLISGKSPFTETIFEDVRVEKDQVVGEINQGWTVAKYLLTHEREMIGDTGLGRTGGATLGQQAVDALGLQDGTLPEPVLRSDIARFEVDADALALTMERFRDEAKAGASLGAVSSMLKYYGTELNMRRQELRMALGGSEALNWRGGEAADGEHARTWLRSRGNSIEGGTSEIMLNIVAKRILGLPG